MTKSQIIRRYLAHLGIILCHLSIAGVVFFVGSFMATLLYIIAFLCGIILIVFSLGLVFLFIPDYFARLGDIGDSLAKFSETSMTLMPTVATLTAVFCVASIVLTALDARWEKARIRLIISSVMVGVVVALLVGIIIGAIGGAA